MKTVCDKNMCSGCMACSEVCPQSAINTIDELKWYNSVIDEKKCINCGACYKVCPQNKQVLKKDPICWYQGWSNDKEIHKRSSSGGFATSISEAFIKQGGCVFGCVFSKGEFVFEIAEDTNQIQKFAGSKYVKSNPKGVYLQIKNKLLENKKVLFIGLPCQVAAVKNYIGTKLEENLYTIDLICHGSPSPKILETFLEQNNSKLDKTEKIIFRTKDKFSIKQNEHFISYPGICDCYTITFLNSVSYTENCYNCLYATSKRISDLTIGDSWGSELPIEKQKAGLSLVLCQTEKGKNLLGWSDLHLEEVEFKRAVEYNHQLREPSRKPEKRDYFFEELRKGTDFKKITKQCFPKEYYKQSVKKILMKLKIVN